MKVLFFMSWEELQRNRNKTNLECGAAMASTLVKPPQLSKTKYAGIVNK